MTECTEVCKKQLAYITAQRAQWIKAFQDLNKSLWWPESIEVRYLGTHHLVDAGRIAYAKSMINAAYVGWVLTGAKVVEIVDTPVPSAPYASGGIDASRGAVLIKDDYYFPDIWLPASILHECVHLKQASWGLSPGQTQPFEAMALGVQQLFFDKLGFKINLFDNTEDSIHHFARWSVGLEVNPT
ncbi:MAG: hypothetical protein PHQ43_00225 [Dehalococcoidales bacterium]|nr:hypothetical protein [Dehalococcoidales bacterium]